MVDHPYQTRRQQKRRSMRTKIRPTPPTFYLFYRCGEYFHPVGYNSEVHVVGGSDILRIVENQYGERFSCHNDESSQFVAFDLARAQDEYRKTLEHYRTPEEMARELVARL